jgi:hypothetical protein
LEVMIRLCGNCSYLHYLYKISAMDLVDHEALCGPCWHLGSRSMLVCHRPYTKALLVWGIPHCGGIPMLLGHPTMGVYPSF